MKITVTGSLGNISHPLTTTLVQKGHTVTVISSNPEKQKDIEALGATAAIGTLEDVDFLTKAFAGADVVYCMVPPNYHTTGDDPVIYCKQIGNNYAQAIRQSGVKRVIHLSSFGADLDKGNGIILGAHHVEKILGALPGIAITHMRPTYFYYNIFRYVGMIKNAGLIATNYGDDDKLILVSPLDIAAAIVEEIETSAAGRKIRYVASEELTASEAARILGNAIGKPDLKWVTISDEQMQRGMETNGVPANIAAYTVEMFACMRSGELSKDYERNKPTVFGKVKLMDFANEFAAVFAKN